MAFKVTVTLNNNTNVAGNRRQVFGTLTFPAAADGGYTTGGNAIDPFMLGLAIIDRLETEPGRIADGTTAIIARLATAVPFQGSPSSPTGLIQAYWTGNGSDVALDEVGNADDISTYVVPFTAWGV